MSDYGDLCRAQRQKKQQNNTARHYRNLDALRALVLTDATISYVALGDHYLVKVARERTRVAHFWPSTGSTRLCGEYAARDNGGRLVAAVETVRCYSIDQLVRYLDTGRAPRHRGD